jgi:hypothetical protein
MAPDPDPSPATNLPEWHREVVMDRLKTLKEEELLTWDEMREQAGLPKAQWLTLDQFMQDEDEE